MRRRELRLPEAGFFTGLLPFASILAFAALSVVPLPIPGYVSVAPPLALLAAYHWTVYRPDLVPPLALFLGGVVADLFAGAPLGPTSLLFLLMRALILPRRHYFVGRLFPFVWSGFTLVAAIAEAAGWAFAGLSAGTVLDPAPAALQWVLAVAAFPPASQMMAWMQVRALATPR